MTIEDAAKATRKYVRYEKQIFLRRGWSGSKSYVTTEDAKTACDIANLRAVLDAIKEPTKAMLVVGEMMTKDGHEIGVVWRAMIDALVAEVKE